MTYNITWGILHGGANTGDAWVRGSGCTPGYHGRPDKAKALFNDMDTSIRGWLVETFVQAALMSSWRDAILELDSLNTYFDALEGPYMKLYTSKMGVFVEKPSVKAGTVYSRSVEYSVSGYGPYEVAFTQSDGTSGTVELSEANGGILLPFYNGTVTLRGLSTVSENGAFTVTLNKLPEYLPEAELSRRMESGNLVEDAGKFCIEILRELK